MPDAANSTTAARPNGVLAVLLLAGLTFALSQTLVVPALPTFSVEYSASATALASMANLIVDSVPQSTVGIATGINTVTRTVRGAFGAAAATAILAAQTIGSSPIPSEGAYTSAFVVSAVGGLLAIAAALAIPSHLRDEPAFDAEASPAPG